MGQVKSVLSQALSEQAKTPAPKDVHLLLLGAKCVLSQTLLAVFVASSLNFKRFQRLGRKQVAQLKFFGREPLLMVVAGESLQGFDVFV